MTKCGICGEATELVHKGKDAWKVHTETGKASCSARFTGCQVATSRHILADGSVCDDPRHHKIGD